MDFSVLMSVYRKDNPEYFELALLSVTQRQRVKPKQVVIVKDGPVSVGINKVIKTIMEEVPYIEFTVIEMDENVGLAAALNRGLKDCKYEWVARMDADDISSPFRFEKQTSFIATHPDVSVLGGLTEEFNNSPGDLKQAYRMVKERHVDILNMAKRRSPMNHPTVIYRKTAVLESGGYCENFGKLEDYKLWVDMISNGFQFANIGEPLVYMRIGNGFIHRRSNKREIEDWDKLQKYLFESKIINRFDVLTNRIYIRVFIYMPGWAKKIAYKVILRK